MEEANEESHMQCEFQPQDMGQYNSSDSEEEQKRGKKRKQQAPQSKGEAITQTQYFKLLDYKQKQNAKEISEMKQTHEKKLEKKEEIIKQLQE